MSDLSTFNPKTVDDLLAELKDQASSVLGAWWGTHSAEVESYLASIASATIQTQAALAAGKISPATAATLMQSHADTLKTTLEYAVFMAEVLAQKLVDAVMTVIAWAIFNETGINVAPGLVTPLAKS